MSMLAERFGAAVAAASGTGDGDGHGLLPTALSAACVEVLGVAGAGVCLVADLRVPLGSSDRDSARAERLQVTLGEGPCLTAIDRGEPLAADSAGIARQWPVFHRELTAQTLFRSVTSLPLRLPGGGPFGALDLYLTDVEPDPFLVSGHVRTEIGDQVAARLLAVPALDPGRAGDVGGAWWSRQAGARMRVWTAVGLLLAETGLGEGDALAALRGHARRHGLTLDEVAELVVSRRLAPALVSPAPASRSGSAPRPAEVARQASADESSVSDPAVSRRLRLTVELAVPLVGARHAALTVREDRAAVEEGDGEVSRCLYSSAAADDLATVCAALALHGVHTADVLSATAQPVGEPGQRPALVSVEIESRYGHYGTLHVLDRAAGGRFTATELVRLRELAGSTAAGIEHALLHARARQRPEWLLATTRINETLLGSFDDLGEETVWRQIADHLHALAGARTVTVEVPDEDDPTRLVVRVAAGTGADQLLGSTATLDGSLAGHALTAQQAVASTVSRWPVPHAAVGTAAPPGPVLALPLQTQGDSRGAVLITRHHGGPLFTTADVRSIGDFVTQAGLALELTETRAAQHRLEARDDDPTRHPADTVHDAVIQQLFALRLTLEAAARRDSAVAPLLTEAVAAVEATISQARSALVAQHSLGTVISGRAD